MFLRACLGFGMLSVVLPSYAASSRWNVEVRDDVAAGIGCAAEISIGIGRRLCVTRQGAERDGSFVLHEGEHLVYVEGDSPNEIGRLVTRFPGVTIRVVTSEEYHSLIADEQSFVMPIELDERSAFDLAAPSGGSFSEGSQGSEGSRGGVDLSRDSLRSFLEVLVGERAYDSASGVVTIPDRLSESGRKMARDVLVDHFQKLGLRTRTQCYSQSGRSGCNVEAILDGVEKENPIVIGAHYDAATVGGADDNGTGTAALMEMARLFSGQRLRKSIAFVAFDQEEAGLVGSAAYVKEVTTSPATTPVLAITIDTMGYDKNNDGKMHLIDCGRAESKPLTQAFLSEKARLGFNLVNVEKCTNRSDHASFWKRNIPAIIVSENFFGGDANPCYHKKCDTIANMNFDYYANIAETVAHTVEALAGR
jgi:hypothetical protein